MSSLEELTSAKVLADQNQVFMNRLTDFMSKGRETLNDLISLQANPVYMGISTEVEIQEHNALLEKIRIFLEG